MRSWNPEYWRACQDGFTGTLRQFQSGAKIMTTKTDAARECAEELTGYLVRCGIIEEDDAATLSDTTYDFTNQIAKHFPPSVPVVKLQALKRYAANVDGGYIESADLEALIAEAK